MYYDERVRANFPFDASKVRQIPTDPYLRQFDILVDYGQDYEGYYVIRQSSSTGRKIRIDFLSPGYY